MELATPDNAAVGQAQLDEVTGALESLVASLDSNGNLQTLLQHVCAHVLQVVPETDMASVTLVRDEQPETAACTDDRVYHLDADQYLIGNGPCLEAAATGQIVRVHVEQAPQRWPRFHASAAEAGVGSYLSAPLTVDSTHSGSINLYSEQSHGYAQTDGTLLELYLTAVAGALRATSRERAAHELVAQLREALTSRATIDQAKGILMGAHRISAEQAFEILVARSQQENRKLRDLAHDFTAEIVDS